MECIILSIGNCRKSEQDGGEVTKENQNSDPFIYEC